jgi:hypothetical protein
LKTITNIINRFIGFASFLVVLFVSVASFGQTQQNGSLYIKDDGVMSIHTSSFNFGVSPATTETSRTVATHGKLHFPASIVWDSASDGHHVNGYVSSYGNAAFTFPVGNGSRLAPAKVQNTTLTASYDCAYYDLNPSTIGSDFDTDALKAISALEYWDVKGSSSAVLSLTWRSESDIANLHAGILLADIVIAAWDGTKWIQIPSTVDTNYLGSGAASSLTVGSVTSTLPINFATYSKFTIAAKGSCSPLVDSNGEVRIWNGAWVNALSAPASAPTLQNPVIIQTAYNAGSFSCNTLQLNADITLNSNQYVEIVNGVTGSSKIIMASSASVVQRANGVGAPTIEMTKTRTGLRRYDYVYFGTPIAGNFFADFATAQASTAASANAFDFFYKYNTGAGGGWQLTTATETGRGLMGHVGQQAPFLDAATQDDINVVFDGVANNGDITLTGISNNPAQANGGTSHVLLGNPYPSAIDADKFIEENTGLDGVIYIWKSTTGYPGSGQYNQADYMAYTKAGTVTTSITQTFDGKIPSAQGFKVKVLPDATNPTTVVATTDVYFTNCMRIIDGNSTFYKSAQNNHSASQNNANETKDRFKLNMVNNNDVFSQILIAYLPQATFGYDRMYDAGRNSVSTAQLYSVLEQDGRRLSINARPNFFDTDIVPLGIRKNNTNSETFVISIAEKEGIFNTSAVTVYLHDKIANTYHDFSTGAFTFTTTETQINDRFEVVYQTTALSNNEFENADVVLLLNDNVLEMSSSLTINNVVVYDLAGRKIEEYTNINETTFKEDFKHEESVYLVKVLLENGIVINKKVIHTKK